MAGPLEEGFSGALRRIPRLILDRDFVVPRNTTLDRQQVAVAADPHPMGRSGDRAPEVVLGEVRPFLVDALFEREAFDVLQRRLDLLGDLLLLELRADVLHAAVAVEDA